ncbi:hypothetical protein LEP1GSC047_1317 [Leptospira inadai serovar Lyme str. 10]|uniref:Uncharacterized protein n=1 Tax=Leptospira inadai serovar Lyme str. 10 TaxID=1049790 RepID=V6H8A7_9LEPT|nr:hypothetical protein LEP1GSC047_1317 [Leptospira inadai serovar Lyme str. 10]
MGLFAMCCQKDPLGTQVRLAVLKTEAHKTPAKRDRAEKFGEFRLIRYKTGFF